MADCLGCLPLHLKRYHLSHVQTAAESMLTVEIPHLRWSRRRVAFPASEVLPLEQYFYFL
jgi:hypothetical protein